MGFDDFLGIEGGNPRTHRFAMLDENLGARPYEAAKLMMFGDGPVVVEVNNDGRIENLLGRARDFLDSKQHDRAIEYCNRVLDIYRANWKQQAYKKGLDYLDYTSFSLSSLVDQLEYEGFTPNEASYGAKKAYKKK